MKQKALELKTCVTVSLKLEVMFYDPLIVVIVVLCQCNVKNFNCQDIKLDSIKGFFL